MTMTFAHSWHSGYGFSLSSSQCPSDKQLLKVTACPVAMGIAAVKLRGKTMTASSFSLLHMLPLYFLW